MFRLPIPEVRRTREFNDCNLPAGKDDGGRFGRNDDPRCGGASGGAGDDTARQNDRGHRARGRVLDDLMNRHGADWPSALLDLKRSGRMASRIARADAHEDPAYAAFEAKAVENLNKTSRTAGGVSDTSSSADKPKLNTEGEALAAKTAENFKNALWAAWEAKEDDFSSGATAQAFAEHIAATVSEGLLQPGQGLYRTWVTKNKQAPPEEIHAGMRAFAEEYARRLTDGSDPIGTAAWVEKTMSYLHPWADGVGRTTKILSGFALARAGIALPTYPDKKTFYAEVTKPEAEWNAYFRSLFPQRRAREVRMPRIVPDSSGLREANDCHEPAGSPIGGQFCSKGGGGGTSAKSTSSKATRKPTMMFADTGADAADAAAAERAGHHIMNYRGVPIYALRGYDTPYYYAPYGAAKDRASRRKLGPMNHTRSIAALKRRINKYARTTGD